VARPKLPPGTHRTNRVTVRFSGDELAVLKVLAEMHSLSVADYLRRAGLQYRMPPAPVAQVNRELADTLAGLGNNINQIARQANRGRVDVDPALFREVIAEVQRLRLQLTADSQELRRAERELRKEHSRTFEDRVLKPR